MTEEPKHKYPGKGVTIWRGQCCSVFRNRLGGLTYRYKATRHGGRPMCEFTLFCEVGAPYVSLFKEFFELYDVKRTIEYADRPYLADYLPKINERHTENK